MNEYCEFTEIEALDASASDVSTGGIGYGRFGTYGSSGQLVDGNTTAPNGYYLYPGVGIYPGIVTPPSYVGVTLPASTLSSARYYQRSFSRPAGTATYSSLQLEAYSDTGLTSLIYSRNISPGYLGGGWRSFDFITGGIVWATLSAGETYRFKISGLTKANDAISVFQMSQSQTGIDFNGASIRVVLTDGVLRAGDTFKLFDADQFTGSLSAATLSALHEQGWTTTLLLTEGILFRRSSGTLVTVR